MLNISNFDFNGQSVRVIKNDDKILFVAKDVCDILGYTKSTSSVVDMHCKIEGCTKLVLPSMGGNQETLLISEGNLYRLVLKSKKKEAEKFESWVCDEVLPTIRKTGKYEVAAKPKTDLEIFSDAVVLAHSIIAQRDAQIKRLEPMAEYTEKVLQSTTTYTATQIAKDLGTTATKLNSLLVVHGVQYKVRDHYVLYAKYQGKGYEKIVTNAYEKKDGGSQTYMQLEWTEYGRALVHKLYNHNLTYSKQYAPMVVNNKGMFP